MIKVPGTWKLSWKLNTELKVTPLVLQYEHLVYGQLVYGQRVWPSNFICTGLLIVEKY